MAKTIFLFRAQEDENYKDFKTRITEVGNQLANDNSNEAVKVTLTSAAPPSVSIIPFKKKKVAAISVYANDRVQLEEDHSAFYVDEAIPVEYTKTWKDQEITPGICLFTLFNKKPGLTQHEFLDRWHNGHTPLSLKIHPLWNYNRNVVTGSSNGNSESWDGIVEEQFRTKSDLLNPFKFFGHLGIMPLRMWQVYSDTKGFLEYHSIEPYFAEEIHLKS